MTINQERFLSMAMVANEFLAKNNAVVNLLPNFTQYYTALQTGITDIQLLAEQQEIDKKGIAIVKNDLKNDLIIKAMNIANKMVAYAHFAKNQILLNEINYTESELKKCADTILKEKCEVIYDKSTQYASEIEDYGVTASMLTELHTSIAKYNSAIPTTRLGITEKKQITEQLANKFDLLNSNIKEIDTIIDIVRYSNVDFYNGYQNARKIVNTGGGYLSLKALIKDKNTGEPIQKVNIVFTQENSKAIVEKKSAEKGRFNISNMQEGKWNVIVSKEGYITQNLKISVVDGETTNLEISLSKSLES